MAYLGYGFYAGAIRASCPHHQHGHLIAHGHYCGVSLQPHRLHRGQHFGCGLPMPALYFMEATGILALISLGHWLEPAPATRPAPPSAT